MNKLISIIVPVYNVEDVIRYCIDSILSQTYSNFELLLVDDGSTDKSGKICDEYADKDSRIRVFHKVNGGVSSARNTGIEAAKGEFICFVDSDDRIKNDFLYLMSETMTNYNADIVVCGYEVFCHNDVIEMRRYSEQAANYLKKCDIYLLVIKTLYSAPWAKLFRKEIIDEYHLRFPEEISLGEDMVFNFLYTDYVNGVYVINQYLYSYYIDNTNSLLRKYRKDLLCDYEKMNQYLVGCLEKWKISDESWMLYYRGRYYQYENVLFNTFSKENTDTFFCKLNYNNSILKKAEFQKCLCTVYGELNCIFRFAYRIKNYIPILIFLSVRRALKND